MATADARFHAVEAPGVESDADLALRARAGDRPAFARIYERYAGAVQELVGPAGVVETSEMSFKFLPPRSPRKGGLYFSRDPRQFSLRLTALGYEAP